MNVRYTPMIVLALGGLALTGGRASAQIGVNPYSGIPNYNAPNYRPYATSGLSPYLNLYGGTNRGGVGGGNRGLNNAAINYYNFTLPGLQAQNPLTNYYANNAQPQYVTGGLQPGDDVQLDPRDPTDKLPRPAGHPSTFNNTAGYFNSYGTIGAAGRPQQQQQQQQPRPTGPAPAGRRY